MSEDGWVKEIRVRGFEYDYGESVWFVLPVSDEGRILHGLACTGSSRGLTVPRVASPLVYSRKSHAVKRARMLAKVFDLDVVKVYLITREECREVRA